MADEGFARLVTLACHDLRTPLATVNGASKLLLRQGGLAEGEARLAELIDGAAAELGSLLGQLTLAARITSGRYTPQLREADSLELASASASASDGRVSVSGDGESLLTDVEAAGRALAALANAALRYGERTSIGWEVSGRSLALSPLEGDAAAVVEGSAPRDLGALVARLVLETLGATLRVEGATLHITLA
jgi:K+-sensing histidine kinase KdpD